MDVRPLALDGPLLLTPARHADARGHFSETWRADVLRPHLGAVAFVQDNEAVSRRRGTVRGLHLQRPPEAQGKLVRVVKGAVFDVVVDARAGSPGFGRHVAVTLEARTGNQIWVPPGFLHGLCTLEDETIVLYKVTAHYNPAHDVGVRWNDPALGIAWPVGADAAIVSPRDAGLPLLAAFAPVEAP